MNQRIHHIIGAIVLCVSLDGCSEEPQTWKQDYGFVWRGVNVTIYGFDRTAEDACGGSLAFTDQYVEAVTHYLGFDPDTRIDYQWMSPERFTGKCPPEALSCTASGVARSRDLPQMHEIIHAVTYQNIGTCPSVLEEGLAEYLGNPSYQYLHVNDVPELGDELDTLLTASPIEAGDYRRAGHFVAFLTERFGIDAVVDLCAELDFYATRADWEQASESVLDVDLDRLLLAYAEYPPCSIQQYRARLMECGGDIDSIVEPGSTTEFSVNMDCSDEDVIGPINGQMIAIRQVWVEEPIYAHVRVENADGLYPPQVLATQACAPCSDKPRLNGNVHPTVYFALEAGLHAFLFYLPADQVDSFDVTITPLIGS
jgi:hypothetical protein